MANKPLLTNIKAGLGCMPFSGCYGSVAENHAIYMIQQAFDLGILFFDTANNYGHHKNEELLGKAIQSFKDHVFISSKIGVKNEGGAITIDGSAQYIKQACDASLQRLKVDCIDLVFYHHLDQSTPIEESIQAMSELVQQGKIKHIGLFEMNLDILKRAIKIHPISAYQAEYSLITKGVEEQILPFCKKHAITFFANAPFSRGLLTPYANNLTPIPTSDIRHLFPRFQLSNFSENQKAIQKIGNFANHLHLSLPQLCLIWLFFKKVVPIFGTTNMQHLEENVKALSLHLSNESIQELESLLLPIEILGARIPQNTQNLYLDF